MQPLGQVYDYKGVAPAYDRIISLATLAEVEEALAVIAQAEAQLKAQGYTVLDETRYYLREALKLRAAQLRGVGGGLEPDYALYLQSQPGFLDRSDQWVIPPGILADTYLGEGFRDLVFGEGNYFATDFLHDVIVVKILGGIVGRVVNFGFGGSPLNSGGDVLSPEELQKLYHAAVVLKLAPSLLYPFLFGSTGLGGPANIGVNPAPSPCHLPSVAQRGG